MIDWSNKVFHLSDAQRARLARQVAEEKQGTLTLPAGYNMVNGAVYPKITPVGEVRKEPNHPPVEEKRPPPPVKECAGFKVGDLVQTESGKVGKITAFWANGQVANIEVQKDITKGYDYSLATRFNWTCRPVDLILIEKAS